MPRTKKETPEDLEISEESFGFDGDTTPEPPTEDVPTLTEAPIEDVPTLEVPTTVTNTGIEHLHAEFGREDLNKAVDKINEIITFINK